MAGSRAMSAREPGQVRKEAALSGHRQAQRDRPAGATGRCQRRGVHLEGGCTVRFFPRRAAAGERALERTGPAAASAEPPDDAVEHRDVVQRALAALSPEEREAIALRFGAELTVPEMAEALGEPLTTVEGRVYRALRKLRTELD